MKTECGIIGCVIEDKIEKQLLYNAMSNIQHRGQDSYGYLTMSKDNNSPRISIIKKIGLLPEIKNVDIEENPIIFLGHMRYSTNTTIENPENNLADSVIDSNIQPICISKKYYIYVAHNGNLPNIKRNMKRIGLEYKTGMSDTYLFKMIWNKLFNTDGLETRNDITLREVINYVKYIIKYVAGSYACVLTFYSETDGFNMIGFRDRFGYKPLSICSINGNYCFVSETVQIPDKRDFINDVNPGEIWCINNKFELKMVKHNEEDNKLINNKIYMCSLEPIYFMKIDSLLFNGLIDVNNFRRMIGVELAKQDLENLYPDKLWYSDDLKTLSKREILYIPESSYCLAMGYSELLCTRVRTDLIFKIENIRSFIESTNEARNGKIKRKFSFNIEDIKKLKEIILIDDSIIRGNSMKFIVETLKNINPILKIHIRIGCPRLIKGCNFGIDLYDDELIALKTNNLEKYFGVESISFLEIERLNKIFSKFGMNNCKMCFGLTEEFNNKTLEW